MRQTTIQVGCLSKQDFDEENPSNGYSIENLIDNIDNSISTNDRKYFKHTDRCKAQNEAFIEDVIEFRKCESTDKKNKDKSGGGIMSFQNCTLQCAEQDNGESYWVSFEEKSFSKGDGFKVYSGRMNGKGPKSGDKCVVKVFRQCSGTENMCRYEVKKCHIAKALAKDFNNLMHSKKLRVKFTTVYWAYMDEVSKIKQLFFTGVRKLTTRETVVFEDDLRVNDEKPHKHRELTLFMDCNGRNKRCVSKDLNTFAHFTYHKSNGELVLCGLDGVQDDDGFFLKTPTIHSRTQDYGKSDRGLQGILEVFRNHVCSEFCKDMIKPVEELSSLPADYKNTRQCSTTTPISNVEPETTTQKMSNCNNNPPLLRQDSVVSGGSLVSDHTLTTVTWRQNSNISQNTESFSGYLEPSAPFEHIGDFEFQPSPPPYSSLNVANWLLQEHAKNSFISSSTRQQTTQPKSSDLVNQVSIESGLGASVFASSDELTFRGTSLDLNANFPEEDIDTSGISTSCCFDDCEDNSRAISIQGSKKRVHFSLSSGVCSNNLSSETTASTTSDDWMEVSKMTTSCARTEQCHCAGLFFCNNNQDNQYCSSHLINHSNEIPHFGVACKSCIPLSNPIAESPPSYADSEMSAGCSDTSKKYLANKTNAINISTLGNSHTNITTVNRVQSSVIHNGSPNSGLKK